jgi:hypothetical protein
MTDRDDFFVGYLPTPPSTTRSLKRFVPLLLLLALLVNVAAHQLSRDPGLATWDLSAPRQWTGVLRLAPYALLEHDQGTSLMVMDSKLGADERARAFDGEHVVVRGHALTRGDEVMIELLSTDDAITVADGPAPPVADPVDLGEATLQGEILDSKCHLGAMRPGSGKTHKACATLCIDGGIPPLLMTRGEDGWPDYLLVAAPDGGPANVLVRDVVGETVRVRGRVSRVGALSVLRLAEGGVERVTAP